MNSRGVDAQQAYDDEGDATFGWLNPLPELPPNLTHTRSALAFFGRLVMAGLLAGVLAMLVSFPLSWPLAIGVCLSWIVGVPLSGIIASIVAKKHRAGVGYPADPDAWSRSYALTFPLCAGVVGAVGVLAALGVAVGTSGEWATANLTPAILLAIVTALTVAGLRYVARAMPHWLFYGVR